MISGRETSSMDLSRVCEYRNSGRAFVPVTGGVCWVFLTLEVVPIIACSKGKLRTSNNGTTSNEETQPTNPLT